MKQKTKREDELQEKLVKNDYYNFKEIKSQNLFMWSLGQIAISQ